MADNADIAAELMERRMEAALSSRLSLRIPNHDPDCEDCGNEIPKPRRDALPWATTCVECQSLRERRGRHVR
ncbi:TraR/DksA family transcriptional regulator [Halomonas citrativorans]|uniref:TraR/DksA family transcriptional regulator n=1 Tax=Halomonas citrativorans TaxID=2742612 RepID=A0ABR9FET5_9GAMM|nr:TraR/DksA family transcriptional regulator [Halomonas citrativorans]MBE0405010.1 TraR/DksA family transcriptional regulator [Halomonas citrativorans]